ncbi:MAG: HesA/MoeB/ThiF family protein [Planctomycetes bacterium]|nr:HesA/MoeB/ThiF family protein [Planctomycetota bacterium]
MLIEERYARQLSLPEIGPEGQKKICGASVLCVGVGGRGSAAIQYLGAAGVGRLGLVDRETVAITDLQRQVVHTMTHLGAPKVFSAEHALRERNPELRIEGYPVDMSAENAIDILSRYDVVLDCSDNFETRFLVNDACFFAQRPLVSGSVFQWGGQVTTFLRVDNGPCYRCMFAEGAQDDVLPPEEEAGVCGVASGVIGLLQAGEALKLILGVGHILHGRLLIFDSLATSFRTVHVRKDPDCALCGIQPTITGVGEASEALPV